MRRVFQFSILYISLILGCEDDAKITQKDFPYFITEKVIQNDSTGVIFSAKVIDKGKEEIINHGFILIDENNDYTFVITDKFDLDKFQLRITSNLEKGRAYSYKAYIQTSKHKVYANVVKFISEGSLAPEILDFYPPGGFDNSLVTIVGNNFGITTDNLSIHLNDIKSEIILFSNDSIIFKTPKTSFYGESTISVKSGSKTVVAEEKFTIIGPSIDSLSKTSGHSGEYLTIYGRNLTQNGENSEVAFGTFPATILKYSEKEIDLIIPFPDDNLLVDKSVLVRYKNGLKTVTDNTSFIIEKSWEKMQNPPFITNGYDKCFSYDNKGYFLDINYKRLMEYNPNNDTWTKISDYPGSINAYSHYAVFGDRLFKLSGANSLGKVYDFWEYNFITNNWLKRENVQFSFYQSTSFVLNNTLIIITDSRQVWSYGNDNNFTRKKDFPEQINLFITYVSQGKAYLVNFGQTWEYDYHNDNWLKESVNPFQPSYYYQSTIGFNLYETCYVLQSGTDLYKFDLLSKNWILISKYPYSGQGVYKTSFVIYDGAYIAALQSSSPIEAPLLFKYKE
jgi:hypothetical protein